MILTARGQCILKLKVIHIFKGIHQDQGQIDYNCMFIAIGRYPVSKLYDICNEVNTSVAPY